MIGAIDFMRAWRDVCTGKCARTGCSLEPYCPIAYEGIKINSSDKEINDLITAVMAEKARRERDAEN